MSLPAPQNSAHGSHIKNDKERSDFICGYRCCGVADAGWSQRITSRYGLLLCVNGAGQISLEGKCCNVMAQSLILLKPNFTHRFVPADNWHILWFHFQVRSHITYALKWHEQLPGMAEVSLSDDEFSAIRSTLEEVHRLDLSRPRNWHDLALLLVESIIVRGFNRSVADYSGEDVVIQSAQKLLTETDEDMDLIAKRCGISRAGLYAKFKSEIGMSPRQYREDARLRRAAQLLELPELLIAEIARQVGIPDAYYFSTRFRSFFGVSPSEFRKQFRHG